MIHTTFTQRNVSVSSAVVNLSFSSLSKRARESFATSASPKQKPVHCAAMNEYKRKNAGMDYHAVLSPESKAGGDSKRDGSCQHHSQSGGSKSGQLEAAGVSISGRPVATEDPSNTGERKVHLQSNTDGEKNISKFDDLANNFKPRSEE